MAIILISDNYKFILQSLIQANMKKLIITLLTLIAINQIFAQAQKQTLPDINLKDINGKLVNVGDYSKKGKIVVVSFWATWCTPCKKELNNINELYEEW